MKRGMYSILWIWFASVGTDTVTIAAPDATTPAPLQAPAKENPQAGPMLGDEAVRATELQFPAEWDSASAAAVGGRLRILEAESVEEGEEATVALYNPATGGENFDAGFPDSYWSVGDLDGGNGSDFWDDVNCNQVSGAFSAWCAGTGSQADCSLYDDNMDAYMCVEAEYSGLSYTGTDRFYFSLWNEVEECCDYAWISIGAFKHEPLHGIGVCNPHLVGTLTFKNTSACTGSCQCHHGRCWKTFRVSLGPSFDHFPFLRICFRFHSDGATTREGTYFDDIRFNGPSDTSIYPIPDGFDGHSCKGDPRCRTNFDCDHGELCKRDDGDCTGEGECFPKPGACSGTIARVCGCNGQTYDNRCKANQAGVNVDHLGACVICSGGPFTIGGVVYSDCTDPLTTGIQDVRVDVTCGTSSYVGTTSGPQGLWQIPNVSCGTCTVCPHKPGHSFKHISPTCHPDEACHTIMVNQANQGANQSIQFLGIGSCTRFDLNHDGFPSIIGDVPLAVDCIYRNDCHCPGQGCLCPGDCNCDGFLSIIGDVPCLVDCFYQGHCEDRCAPLSEAATASAGFTIGGAVFTDARDPIATGLANVVVELIAVTDPQVRFHTTTDGDFGLWRIDDVPEGAYRVIYDVGAGSGMPIEKSLVIEVSAENEAVNQSLTLHSLAETAPKKREADRRGVRGRR